MESVKRPKRSDDWCIVFGIICGEIDTLLPSSAIVAWHAVCVSTRTEMETDTWSALKRVQVFFADHMGQGSATRDDIHQLIDRASPLTEQKADNIIMVLTRPMREQRYDYAKWWIERAFTTPFWDHCYGGVAPRAAHFPQ